MAYPTSNEATDEVLARFWAKIARGEPDQCWEWQGTLATRGYGSFYYNGRPTGTHRIALALSLGRVLLADEYSCHHCDNPPCCNPAHLFAGSAQANVADMIAKGRRGRIIRDESKVRFWKREKHPSAKLTEADVANIRARRTAGETLASLAREYGVNPGHLSNVAAGKYWPIGGAA